MQNRYSPPSQWIKSVVDQRLLGDIHLVQVNCYWNRDERYYKAGSWKGSNALDGGTLFTQFSHFIDILYWLFGDITDIQGKFADFNHNDLTEFEDSGLVTFRFLDGGMGCLNYSTAVWDKNLESSMTIIGSNGSVKIGGQYMDQVEYCHIKGLHHAGARAHQSRQRLRGLQGQRQQPRLHHRQRGGHPAWPQHTYHQRARRSQSRGDHRTHLREEE
jgi:UDP-N-acetyl-2-amino-2-deoxyglucuronate dehydrogenase